MEIALNTPVFKPDPDSDTAPDGVVVDNLVELSAFITNTIRMGDADGWGANLGDAADDFFTTDNLHKATFDYTIQDSKKDLHGSLSQGTLVWGDDNSRVFTAKDSFVLSEAGVNQKLQVYLTEAFNIPAYECAGAGVKGCWDSPFKDSYHYPWEDIFVFDVLPNSFSDFIAVQSVGNGSFRLSWDDSFPTLVDADGDGLVSQAAGGNDPDDGNPDSDSDGLSDFFEFQNGYDPQNDDPDCDGLTDYWEAFYRTDPWLKDSDRDGLADGAEVFHANFLYPYENNARSNTNFLNPCENENAEEFTGGWEVVYDFGPGGNPLGTWVSSDPASFDTDLDGILDNFEFIYGYNPNAVSSLNVLSLDSGVVGGNYALPGETLVYTATIKNELDNRYAQGLLQTESPVDTLLSTEVMELLAPLDVVTLAGNLEIPSTITASTSTSLTVRAGAIIADLATDRLIWLHLNEEADSTIFADDSLTGHDFSCNGDTCPNANDSYLNFVAATDTELDGDVIRMQGNSADLQVEDFTLGAWIRPSTPGNQTDYVLFDNEIQFSLNQVGQTSMRPIITYNDGQSDVEIVLSDVDIPFGQWTHLMFTWNTNNAGRATLKTYVNGNQRGDAETGLDEIVYLGDQTPSISPVGDFGRI